MGNYVKKNFSIWYTNESVLMFFVKLQIYEWTISLDTVFCNLQNLVVCVCGTYIIFSNFECGCLFN